LRLGYLDYGDGAGGLSLPRACASLSNVNIY